MVRNGKGLTAVVVCSLISIAFGRELEDYCWFYAGFDSPARIAGGEFKMSLDPAASQPGRYGQGYYFHAPTENLLPPMADFLADASNFEVGGGATLTTGEKLAFSGGTLRVKARHLALRSDYPTRTDLAGGYACSFYAKGGKGTTVTARIVARTLSSEDLAEIADACAKNGWPLPSSTALRTDELTDGTAAMTGDWRRIYAIIRLDRRETACGRTLALDIDATGPVELKDFQYQQVATYPDFGNFNPRVFIDGGMSRKLTFPGCNDPTVMCSFPWNEGSFSTWVLSSEDDAVPTSAFPLWGVSRSWKNDWQFDGKNFMVGQQPPAGVARTAQVGCYSGQFVRPSCWSHYVCTWKDGVLRSYVDGRPVASKDVGADFSIQEACTFRFGTAGDSLSAANCIVDDFAIFSTALTDEEVAAIAGSTTPLFHGSTRLLVKPVSFSTFFRNETNAAIRLSVYVPAAGRYDLTGEVGGDALQPQAYDLSVGSHWLAVPFDPARYRVGTYPCRLSFAASGVMCAEVRCDVKVRERLERDSFRVMNWGGSSAVHHDFMRTMGVNCTNVGDENAMRDAIDAGIMANLKFFNSSKITPYDHDYAAIAAEATNDFAYAVGQYGWVSTLVNTEIYGAATARSYTNSETFVERARLEVGCEPEWIFGGDSHSAPCVLWGSKNMKAPTGIWGGDDPSYRTLVWYLDGGMPGYRLAAETAKVIHGMSPGNCVWTEPVIGPGGMGLYADMLAGWSYSSDELFILSDTRSEGGCQRAIGKPFMPTLGPGYGTGKGRNPDAPGTAVSLVQSCDSMEIQSWICLGSTPCSHLSIFGLDAWEGAVSNAVALAEEPMATPSAVAEPDAAEKYGRFVRERYLPTAELLRDLANVPAPLAVIYTAEDMHGSDFGWGTDHYPNSIHAALTAAGIPFDVLHEHEIDAEHLKRYPFVFFPLSKCVTPAHDAALKEAAAAGTTIVLDKYANFAGNYAGAVQLTDCRYISSNSLEIRLGGVKSLVDWARNQLSSMCAHMSSWSDGDIVERPKSFTFEKTLDGVRYVTVVNNARCRGDSLLTRFSTNDTERLHGAAQTITTHLKQAEGTAVYEFDAKAAGAQLASDVTLDYGPAEAKTFAVYPRPLARLAVATGGDFRPGRKAWLDVSLADAAGDLAPGRQVVEVELFTPYGERRDESGFYSMTGSRRIPLRFARADPLGSNGWPWRLKVRELTTGFTQELTFVCVEDTSCAAANYVEVVGSPVCYGNGTYGEIAYRGDDAAFDWSVCSDLVTWSDGVKAVRVSETERAVFLGWTLTNGVGRVTEGAEPTFRWNRTQGDVLTVHWRLQGDGLVVPEVVHGKLVCNGRELAPGGNWFESGEPVVTAVPDEGYSFSCWISDGADPFDVDPDNPARIDLRRFGTHVPTPVFRKCPRLVLKAGGEGAGLVRVRDPSAGRELVPAALVVTNWFDYGTTVSIEALPQGASSRFVEWLCDDVEDPGMPQTTIVLLEDREIVARFAVKRAAATLTWKGSGGGEWQNPANWEGGNGETPADGDTVVIPAAKTARTIEVSRTTPPLKSVTVGSKTTLRMSNWNTKLVAESVTVANGGEIAPAGPFADDEMSNRVWIVCTDLDVQAGGAINANARGYHGQCGPGWGGGTDRTNRGIGGSYGGSSSDGTTICYGSVSEPTEPGTGTGGSSTTKAAGGAIRIDATGDVTVNGVVSADGDASVLWTSSGCSGGSVYISCRTISGSGSVSARSKDNLSLTGGHEGGGGGRIAVHYDPAFQAAKDAACAIGFDACGGIGSIGIPSQRNNTNAGYVAPLKRPLGVGGLGSLWFTDNRFLTSATYRQVGWKFTGVWHSGEGLPARLAVQGPITLDSNILCFEGAGTCLDIDGNLAVTGTHGRSSGLVASNVCVTVKGDATVGGGCLQVEDARLTVTGDLTLSGDGKPEDAAQLIVKGGAAGVKGGPFGAEVRVGGTWSLANEAVVYPHVHPTEGTIPYFEARNVSFASASRIDGTMLGYAAGKGPGNGGTAGGASHGGRGSANSVANWEKLPPLYGSVEEPCTAGSGGGDGLRGGSAIRVHARERMQMDGKLLVQGNSYGLNWQRGAAGGSVYLSAGTFASDGGVINARGGMGTAYNPGAGGGGRVSIRAQAFETKDVAIDVAGGVRTSGADAFPSEDGTVYWGELADPIPLLDGKATAEEVAAALQGTRDETRLTANIRDATAYGLFRAWSQKIGAECVRGAPYAWLGFAADSPVLPERLPTGEDLEIESFVPTAESGRFDFTVRVRDLPIGSQAMAENLKKLFGLAGTTTLDGAVFSSDGVELEFSQPEDGKLRFKAGPKDVATPAFFMKMDVRQF